MEILSNVALDSYSTFRMGGVAAYFVEVHSEDELVQALAVAQEKALPVWILGGGSNTLIPDAATFQGLVIRIAIPGFALLEDGKTVRVGAGEVWDAVVKRTIDMGLSGLEALSYIPGTVGAVPVQNVGAYGQEVGNSITSVRAYDRLRRMFVSFSRDACNFSYRNSMFKQDKQSRFVITSVDFLLSTEQPKTPSYAGVRAYFDDRGISDPTLLQIREAIIAIRKRKLPDPSDIASVGSFFKNPIVPVAVAEVIQNSYDDFSFFPAGDGYVKVSAGWLIERAGFKGKRFGGLGLYEQNALVVVHYGGASYAELEELVTHIQKTVHDRFGIMLEQEPVVLGEV